MSLLVFAQLVLRPVDGAFTGKTSTAQEFGASTAFSYRAGVLYDNPSLYWRLADAAGSATFADTSGNNRTGTNPATDTGTAASRYQVAGAAIGDGDTAAYFDGSDSNVISDSNGTGGADYAVEVWFKTSSAAGGIIVANVGGPTTNPWAWTRMMYVDSGGRLTYGDWAAPDTVKTIRSSGVVNNGVWHHAVGWHSGTTLALYVDGVSQGTVTAAAQAANDRWVLGGASIPWVGSQWTNTSTSTYFTGSIDEFAFYTSALTGAKVTTHRNAISNGTGYANAVKADSPAIYWRLGDSPLSTNTTDSSGNNATGQYYLTDRIVGAQPGALTIANNSTWFSGRGTNAYQSTAAAAAPNTFTILLWFKTSTRRGGSLVQFADTTTSAPYSYDRIIYMLNDGRLAFGAWTGTAVVVTTTASYNNGQWHHVAASVGPAGLKLYVDGTLIGQDPTTTAENNTGYWRLGGGGADWPNPPTSTYFSGWLDEFTVNGTQLPDARITQLYNVR